MFDDENKLKFIYVLVDKAPTENVETGRIKAEILLEICDLLEKKAKVEKK